MENQLKLFYLILGTTPKGRNIEQHDVFFGIAHNLNELIQDIKDFWKEADKIHIDCYQEVRFADGYEVIITDKQSAGSNQNLYFLNLGGYKRGVFQEYHEQHLMVGTSLSEIIKRAKETDFYKTMGFDDAQSHIDDKHGVDIDDIYNVRDILPERMKEKYSISFKKSNEENQENEIGLGYLKIDKIPEGL